MLEPKKKRQQKPEQVEIKVFNYLGFFAAIAIAVGSSLIISIEDNDLTTIEILRGVITGSVAGFSYTQSPTVTIWRSITRVEEKNDEPNEH